MKHLDLDPATAPHQLIETIDIVNKTSGLKSFIEKHENLNFKSLLDRVENLIHDYNGLELTRGNDYGVVRLNNSEFVLRLRKVLSTTEIELVIAGLPLDIHKFFIDNDIINQLLRQDWLTRENIFEQRQKLPSPALLREAETLYYDYKLEQWKSNRRLCHKCNHSKYFMSSRADWVLDTFSIQFDLVTEKTGTLLINDEIQITKVRESTVNKFIEEILEDLCWW
jgi:hypothetical protein